MTGRWSILLGIVLTLALAACGGKSKTAGDVSADGTGHDVAADSTTPDASSDATAPDAASPDAANPDAAGPDTAGPDAVSDTALPEPAPDVPAEAAPDAPSDTGTGHRYDPPDPATTYVYRVFKAGSADTLDLPARFAANEVKNGHEYRRLELGDLTAAEVWGLVLWSNYADDRLETGGVEVYNPGAPGQPSFAYLFDEPWGGSLLAEDGTSSTSSATGTFAIAGQEFPFEITVDFTLVSSDESVDVPAGTIAHCIHYRFTENSSDLTGFVTDYWIKSGTGMVKATTIPGFDALELVSVSLPD